MPGAISVAGSFAPPCRTTTFRGATPGVDWVRDWRLVTPLFVSALEAAPLGALGLVESGLAGSVFEELVLEESVSVESGAASGFAGLIFAESVFAESGSVFVFASLSGAFFPASVSGAFFSVGVLVSGAAAAAGATGACSTGAGSVGDCAEADAGSACPEAFAEPVASCRRELIPQERRLSPSASATVKANRMSVTRRLFRTLARKASARCAGHKRKSREAYAPRLVLRS